MKPIQIPDRSRDSLAPYLPIPYGSLKLLGMVVSIVLVILVNVVPHIWFPLQIWASALGLFVSCLFMAIGYLIMKIAQRDVDSRTMREWWHEYTKRNLRGYRLWIYQKNTVSAPVRYFILREGDDPSVHLAAEFLNPRDRPTVMISIPLLGRTVVPTVWAQFHQLEPRPFTILLVDRKFRHDWQVIVQDFYGNRLTLPVEHALEIVSCRTPRVAALRQRLSQVYLDLRHEYDNESERRARNCSDFMDARGAVEKAVEMIQVSTRFQRSKEGKAIREFLELRLRMLYTGESEEEARKKMADTAA